VTRMKAVPVATYRLQFNRDFRFTDAAALVPYLHRLGVSHVYASPCFKARAGSPHGYDIVDHNALNPEIGDSAGFSACSEALQAHGMGQILDIVPNHMAVGGDDNSWWLSVLEHGEASPFAAFFDIDWRPVNPVFHNRVLLPFLADHYGTVLEQGDLRLGFDAAEGAFAVRYHEHLFPVDPRTYPRILALGGDTWIEQGDLDSKLKRELRALVDNCRELPRRGGLSRARRRQRLQEAIDCKRRLAALCRLNPELNRFIRRNLNYLNGTPGFPSSFDMLHLLLERQAYRLAYWRVAADDINYRRFFDINALAGIRMENSEVFEATHRLVFRLLSSGRIDGLRIDHPDGLSDPRGYCASLAALARQTGGGSSPAGTPGCRLLVEKILATHERLPGDWPVAGTTGYEVSHLLNGLFVQASSERALSRIHARFTGNSIDFDELLYHSKKLIIRSVLSSELTMLGNLLGSIAQSRRNTRDFTYQGLRDALAEVVACFPVYRTYISPGRISTGDRQSVQWAIMQAKKRSRAADTLIFDFISDLILLSAITAYPYAARKRILQFIGRFQQYTAPVMAKGMEDTAFYSYHRLISLNDVGFDPRRFGMPVDTFHQENRQRLADWPHSMVTTSTHDSKRGEDVRMRINVLSEMPREWQRHLRCWMDMNRREKRLVNGTPAPSANDEYLLYQTLVGSWPYGLSEDDGLADYAERIQGYMLKAIREAKVHTSWINPDPAYEEAVDHFVGILLGSRQDNPFLADFMPFQAQIARCGMFGSLSQTLLKLTIPGIPDLYQGSELWDLNLVDPDNRRAVDYGIRQSALERIIEGFGGAGNKPAYARRLLARIPDGEAKLFLIWRVLALRNRYPELLIEGDYRGLEATGERSAHVVAFQRRRGEREMIVVASRWFWCLPPQPSGLPLGEAAWGDSELMLPTAIAGKRYRNIFTDEQVLGIRKGEGVAFRLADLLGNFSVALLVDQSMAVP